MIRHVIAIVVIALMAVAVGAQPPKALTSAQKGELFKKNREIFEKVVDETVASSKSPNDPLKRANTYYPLLLHFSKQISSANSQDSRRVEELSQHLKTLLDKGLTPTLAEAKRQVEGGTGVDDFIKIRQDLLAQLNALLDVLSNDPATKGSLEGAKNRLDSIKIPQAKQ
jgi:hypothetical protein